MRNLKGLLFLLGGVALGVLVGVLVLQAISSRASADRRRLPPAVGQPVKDFELVDLDGQVRRLSDLRGQPVVINFWATWCGPCKDEMPLLQQYADRYAGQMTLLGVDYQEEQAVVREFVETYGIDFPILLDRDGRAAEQYFVRNFPATFFVDAEGTLRAQHLGLLTEERLVDYLSTIGLSE